MGRGVRGRGMGADKEGKGSVVGEGLMEARGARNERLDAVVGGRAGAEGGLRVARCLKGGVKKERGTACG